MSLTDIKLNTGEEASLLVSRLGWFKTKVSMSGNEITLEWYFKLQVGDAHETKTPRIRRFACLAQINPYKK